MTNSDPPDVDRLVELAVPWHKTVMTGILLLLSSFMMDFRLFRTSLPDVSSLARRYRGSAPGRASPAVTNRRMRARARHITRNIVCHRFLFDDGPLLAAAVNAG